MLTGGVIKRNKNQNHGIGWVVSALQKRFSPLLKETPDSDTLDHTEVAQFVLILIRCVVVPKAVGARLQSSLRRIYIGETDRCQCEEDCSNMDSRRSSASRKPERKNTRNTVQ